MESHERRQEPRKAALMHAFVSDRANSIDMKCVIREISKGGCRVTSSYVEDLPRVVRVLPEGFETPLTGKIVWRNKKFAGVQFISEAEADELESAKTASANEPDPVGFFGRLQSFVSLRRRAGLLTAEKTAVGMKPRKPFMAGVLRVLSNPLAALKGLLGLLTDTENAPRDPEYVLKAAQKNAELADGIVSDALRAKDIENGVLPCRPEPTDIVVLVNNALMAATGHAMKNGVRFELDDQVSKATVAADAGRLEEVIGHLLSRAAQSSPEGETIKLSLSRNEDRVRVTVQDQGLGTAGDQGDAGEIAPLDEIADQNVQWLKICHAVLAKHGSRLQVDSQPGTGTTAWFEIKESA
ncbi:MAG: ATP-binding protein [Hyphomicrobiaceae bacterium]|nr:ATP-binding protein [Hyphomicrobiaceae bacterium]